MSHGCTDTSAPPHTHTEVAIAEVDAGGWPKVTLVTTGMRASTYKATSFQAPMVSLRPPLLSYNMVLIDASLHRCRCSDLAPPPHHHKIACVLLLYPNGKGRMQKSPTKGSHPADCSHYSEEPGHVGTKGFPVRCCSGLPWQQTLLS